MARLNVTPTRMNLQNLRRRLATSTRGHKLLKDKQDELMRQFIEKIKENKALREKVEAKLQESFNDFFMAAATMSPEALEEAVALPTQSTLVDIDVKNVMSVMIPRMTFHTEKLSETGSMYPYGYAFTTADLDEAIVKLQETMDDLLELAEMEKSTQLMADEIEKTRRRVNALEYKTIPDLEETVKYIRQKLDEDDRATITRLMKVKDIISKEKTKEPKVERATEDLLA